MDIALLKTFLEVARTRHFGKAADALFVTQSAVSARIKLLESNLAVELFSRRRNDIQLTPAGMRLIRHAETIVKGWERARHEIALGWKGAESLAVGCPFDLWGILLRDWAATLRSQSPQLVLQIEVQPTDLLMSRLVNGLLDLALLFEPPQILDLVIKQVADVPLILVSGRDGCSAEEALGRDYYMVDWGSIFTLSHADRFPDIPPPAARLASGTLARDLILASGGSAYLAEQMVQQDLARGVLFLVADAPIIERAAFAVYRPGDEKRSEMRQALEALRWIGGNSVSKRSN
jgi:DNA-binding transcriptional LysR family regulator